MLDAEHWFSLFILCLSLLPSIVAAFSFAYTPPTQCDPFTLSWTGGTPPYDIILIPDFNSPRKFSIPSFPENGSFTITLPLSSGQTFVVAMSDATGFGAGGVSDILTVGSSITQTSCSTAVPALSFLFDLPDELVQCSPYNFTWDVNAVQPVTITGAIPLGQPLRLTSPAAGPDFFVWDPVNVAAGTSMIFFLSDSEGRFGGSSHILQVGASSDNSCINSQSPQSTISGAPTAISSTGSPTPSTSAPQATVTVTPSSGVSAAAIGGAVAGSLVACLIIGTLAVFFFRTYLPGRRAASRYTHKHPFEGPSPLPPNDPYRPRSSNPLTDLSPRQYDSGASAPSHWTTFSSSAVTPSEYITEPFSDPSGVHERYPQNTATFSQSTLLPHNPAQSSTRPSHTAKSSVEYPPNKPARFILHTDADDDDTIELPPQYRARSQPPNDAQQ